MVGGTLNAPAPPGAAAWVSNMVALYVALLRSGHHFAQSVYGDGEWKNILGTGAGTNDQGEAFCDALGDGLRRTLLKPSGQWNVLWPGRAGSRTHQKAREWIRKYAPDTTWLPFRPLSWAAVMGLLAPFLREVRRHRVILVGPRHLKRLPRDVLDPAEHIRVPDCTAWERTDEVVAAVSDVLTDGDLVFFSAGQGSCLMIHRLWMDVAGRATLVDMGSVWDPYCGVESRRVYSTPSFRKLKQRNIP